MLNKFRSRFTGGLVSRSAATRRSRGRGRRAVRLLVEGLEDRTVLSSGSPGIRSLLTAGPLGLVGSAAPALGLGPQAGSGLENADTGFLQNAAAGNMQEILLGALASQLATNSDTAAFGQKLMSDHTTALIADALILQAEGVGMPSLTLEQMQTVEQFATMPPGQFDAAFASFMVTDHQQDIANFQNEIQNGSDPLARAYALLALPALEQHMQIATTLQAEYGSGQPGNPGQSPTGQGSPDEADAAFLQAAEQGSVQEILLGAIGSQLAKNSDTAAFGQRLVADHTATLIDAAAIMQVEGVYLQTQSQEQIDNVVQFATMSPAQFDAQFANFMVMDHQQDIANFQYELQIGTDPLARGYAMMALPTLEQHLQIATTLQAEYANGQPGSSGQNSPSQDAAFLQDAAVGSIQEILLGALASQLAANSDTAAFGQRLMTDHSGSFIAAAWIMQAEGVNLPTLTQDLVQNLAQFATIPSDQFDAQFASFMVTDHQLDVAKFENEIHNGSDPLARAYAMLTLPALEQHLQIAMNLQAEYGSGQPGNPGQNSTGQGSPDAAFLQNAFQGSIQDILLGALAGPLAVNNDTAAFGQQLVSGSASSLLAAAGILQAEGVDLPTLTQSLMQNVQQLATPGSGQFDAQFANFMVTEQQQGIANFQNELQNGTDPLVLAYATSSLPGLQQQLQTATTLQSEYGGGGG